MRCVHRFACVCAQGLDISSLSALVFLTPGRGDIVQALGRILRKHPSKCMGVRVIDVMDRPVQICIGLFYQRNAIYRDHDANVTRVCIDQFDQ